MKTDVWSEYEEFEVDERPRRRAAKAEQKEEHEEKSGPLASFFADEWIVGEPAVVKSGKEATLYCCQAHPRTGYKWLAAKVYRPRQQRGFKNDAVYQQGRTTLNKRLDKAIQQKSKKGRETQFGMWIGHEFGTLSRLHAAGADVPRPLSCAQSAILMEYIGERGLSAPQLYNVELKPAEVRPLFERMLHNLEIFMECDRVHGDLSPYNILYWQGSLKIIDFPQAVDPMDNPQAFMLFERDVEYVCEYFAAYGIQSDPHRLALNLWLDCGRAWPKGVPYSKLY